MTIVLGQHLGDNVELFGKTVGKGCPFEALYLSGV